MPLLLESSRSIVGAASPHCKSRARRLPHRKGLRRLGRPDSPNPREADVRALSVRHSPSCQPEARHRVAKRPPRASSRPVCSSAFRRPSSPLYGPAAQASCLWSFRPRPPTGGRSSPPRSPLRQYAVGMAGDWKSGWREEWRIPGTSPTAPQPCAAISRHSSPQPSTRPSLHPSRPPASIHALGSRLRLPVEAQGVARYGAVDLPAPPLGAKGRHIAHSEVAARSSRRQMITAVLSPPCAARLLQEKLRSADYSSRHWMRSCGSWSKDTTAAQNAAELFSTYVRSK